MRSRPPERLVPEDTAKRKPARERLITAALELFAEKGFRSATTKELAKRAGVTEKTLYTHFRSKDELFAEVIRPGLEGMMGSHVFAELAPLLTRTNSPEERLVALAKNRLTFAEHNAELMKVVFQELLLDPKFRTVFRSYFEANLLPGVRAFADGAIEAGKMRDVSSDRAVRTFISMVIGYVVLRHVLAPEHEWDDDEEAVAIADLFMNGVASDSARSE